jgi:hypothetical protein
MATKKKVLSKKPNRKRVSGGHFSNTPSKIQLAPGAMTRLFGAGNEPTDNASISESELILADAEMNPHLYPALSKPKKKPVNPSGKSGYYKR